MSVFCIFKIYFYCIFSFFVSYEFQIFLFYISLCYFICHSHTLLHFLHVFQVISHFHFRFFFGFILFCLLLFCFALFVYNLSQPYKLKIDINQYIVLFNEICRLFIAIFVVFVCLCFVYKSMSVNADKEIYLLSKYLFEGELYE